MTALFLFFLMFVTTIVIMLWTHKEQVFRLAVYLSGCLIGLILSPPLYLYWVFKRRYPNFIYEFAKKNGYYITENGEILKKENM